MGGGGGLSVYTWSPVCLLACLVYWLENPVCAALFSVGKSVRAWKSRWILRARPCPLRNALIPDNNDLIDARSCSFTRGLLAQRAKKKTKKKRDAVKKKKI